MSIFFKMLCLERLVGPARMVSPLKLTVVVFVHMLLHAQQILLYVGMVNYIVIVVHLLNHITVRLFQKLWNQ